MAGKKKSGWGGARRGAGRPKGTNPDIIHHVKRPDIDGKNPLLVTMRARAGVLSKQRARDAVGKALQIDRDEGRDASRVDSEDFRVVHFRVSDDRIHVIVEAKGGGALARGMQGLGIRLAKRINAGIKGEGRIWSQRYEAKELETPEDARAALELVLHTKDTKALERAIEDRAEKSGAPRTRLLKGGWRSARATKK